jgi:hypothetical protein
MAALVEVCDHIRPDKACPARDQKHEHPATAAKPSFAPAEGDAQCGPTGTAIRAAVNLGGLELWTGCLWPANRYRSAQGKLSEGLTHTNES